MGDKSKIEWTEATWNPVTGCTKVSDGCKHCYAERMWCRLSAPGMPYAGRKFTDVQCHPDRLDQPLRWKKSRRIFVNSMSDLFHEDVPFEFIHKVFAVMGRSQHHTFQVLTKRPERMLDYFQSDPYQSILNASYKLKHRPEGMGSGISDPNILPMQNVWLGVSVEDQKTADERIPLLLQTPATVRWLSIEPMLGSMDITMALEQFHSHDPLLGRKPAPIQWVVVGGESGPKARPMHPDWVRSVRDQCQAAGVPFFFKQWGEYRHLTLKHLAEIGSYPHKASFWPAIGDFERIGKKKAGRTLDGQTWEEYPDENLPNL